MPFTIDVDLIENNKVKITEDSNGNLEIVHVPSGTTLTLDGDASTSNITVSGDGLKESEGAIQLDEDYSATWASLQIFNANIDASSSSLMSLPQVSSDPTASAGDMWYRTDLD